MANLSLRLPDSLHRGVKELIKREGVSINQIIVPRRAGGAGARPNLKELPNAQDPTE